MFATPYGCGLRKRKSTRRLDGSAAENLRLRLASASHDGQGGYAVRRRPLNQLAADGEMSY